MKQKKTVANPKMKFYEEFNGEMFVVDNLIDLPEQLAPTKTELNLFVLCNQGRIQLEFGNTFIVFKAGQMCVLPSSKMIKGVMASPDVNISALCLSDKVLKSILSSQIGIWNKAMYLQKTYVIDAEWCLGLKYYIFSIFSGRHSSLFKEIAVSFMRTFILLICEQFCLSDENPAVQEDPKRGLLREDILFSKFLESLSHQPVKRHPVSFYAAELCVTPKFLAGLCTRVSGKSPLKWITEYTMEDIYALLRLTDKSLKEIAQQTGFSNVSFFGKFFREQSGMTPLEYRQQEQKNRGS